MVLKEICNYTSSHIKFSGNESSNNMRLLSPWDCSCCFRLVWMKVDSCCPHCWAPLAHQVTATRAHTDPESGRLATCAQQRVGLLINHQRTIYSWVFNWYLPQGCREMAMCGNLRWQTSSCHLFCPLSHASCLTSEALKVPRKTQSKNEHKEARTWMKSCCNLFQSP